MNGIFQKLLISILLVVFGVLLKKGYIPNTKSEGNFWLLLVIIGFVNIALNILLVIIRS